MTHAAEEPFYLIGPGDSLEITVRDQPELSRTVTVRPDGRLTIPLVEDMLTSGLTPEELARAIEERLAVYLNNPLVSVAVANPQGMLDQRIRVLGEVVRPTSLPYRAGITLLDAIIEIGGLDPFADGNGAKIIRRSALGETEIALRLDDLITDGDASANMALAPGDIIVVPEGFFSGNFRSEPGVNASLTFTDNINLEPKGEKSSAFITRLGSSVRSSALLARFTGNLASNYDLVFVNHESGPSLDGQLTGASTTELNRDHLFFDLNAGFNRSALNQRQSGSNSRFVTTNRDTVITLSASPYLIHRLGNFADAQWRYRISPVLIDSDTNPNTLTHSISNTLTGRRAVQGIEWSLFTQAGQTVRDDQGNNRLTDTTEFADTSLDLSYGLWRGFSLLGSVGYIYRTGDRVDGVNQLDGISWDAGFEWQPDPRTSLSATYGKRDRDNTFSGSVRHQIGPKTSIQASYRDQRLTDQERFAQGLNNSTINDQDNFIDPDTGLPFNPNVPGANFDDTTSRTRTVNGSIQHSSGLTTVTLAGSSSRRSGGFNGDQDTDRATLSGTQRLSRQMSLSSSASIERRDYAVDSREDDVYRFNGALSYQLFSAASANLSYSFQKQDSSNNGNDFIENTLSVGVSVNF